MARKKGNIPIPVLPPVTRTTFPVRSGMSFSVNFDGGGLSESQISNRLSKFMKFMTVAAMAQATGGYCAT